MENRLVLRDYNSPISEDLAVSSLKKHNLEYIITKKFRHTIIEFDGAFHDVKNFVEDMEYHGASLDS